METFFRQSITDSSRILAPINSSERSRPWTFNVGARGFFHKTSPSPSSLVCSRRECCSTASVYRDQWHAREFSPPLEGCAGLASSATCAWCCAAGGLYAEFQAVAAAFLEFARAAGPTGFYLYTSSTRPCERPNGRGRRDSLTECVRSSQLGSNSLHRARRSGMFSSFDLLRSGISRNIELKYKQINLYLSRNFITFNKYKNIICE